MGIDPISLIVAALAAGAAAAAKDTASQAVKDAYNGLKALIHKRFAGRPEASVALTQHELAPQVWQAPLKDSLDKTGAANDPIILEAARRLDTVLRQEGGGVSATGPRGPTGQQPGPNWCGYRNERCFPGGAFDLRHKRKRSDPAARLLEHDP